jgi:hypothetical protein
MHGVCSERGGVLRERECRERGIHWGWVVGCRDQRILLRCAKYIRIYIYIYIYIYSHYNLIVGYIPGTLYIYIWIYSVLAHATHKRVMCVAVSGYSHACACDERMGVWVCVCVAVSVTERERARARERERERESKLAWFCVPVSHGFVCRFLCAC